VYKENWTQILIPRKNILHTIHHVTGGIALTHCVESTKLLYGEPG